MSSIHTAVAPAHHTEPYGRRYLLILLMVFVAYVIAGKAGQATTHIRSSNLGPVWPAYGVALASVIVYGSRVWPGLAAAAFLVAVTSPVPAVTAAGQAASATLAALVGGLLLSRVRFNRSLSRLRDALAVIVLGALVSALVSATLGVSVLYVTGVQAYDGIASAWLIYWLGDATGVLLITPLVLSVPALRRTNSVARIAELIALLVGLTLVCSAIFADSRLFSVEGHVLAFAVLPFIIWAAIRFGVIGVTLANVIVATIATVGTALGLGPFSRGTAVTNALLLDVFFTVLSVSGTLLAAVIAEREQTEGERARLAREQATLEAVRESEDNLRLILESTAESIFGIDRDGRCTFCNPACLRALGYESVNQLLGQDMHALIHHTRSDGSAYSVDECPILGVFHASEGIHVEDELLWRADGTSFHAEYWSHPQRKGHEVVGAVIAFIDITQRKHSEMQVTMLREELVHLGRVAMLDALAASLAHEINQPLAAVTANTEAALRFLSVSPPPLAELSETLSDIRNDNQRAGEVVQRMRTLLKKDRSRHEPFDAYAAVSDVLKLMKGNAASRRIVIDVHRATRLGPILGDRTQFQQVLLNLLMNACDAVQEVDPSLRRVSLRTAQSGVMAVVEVSDRGPGLSDGEIAGVFEPFYTTKRDGMGLGLSICRVIVQAHGGTLEATRNPGGGMTFSATFRLFMPATHMVTGAGAERLASS